MTAQTRNKFVYKDGYSVIRMSRALKFNPEEYGITPYSVCTACWNGYYCEYAIVENQLVLQNLYINAKDDVYPAICGVEVDPEARDYMGHHVYKNLNIPVQENVNILVGTDYAHQYDDYDNRSVLNFHVREEIKVIQGGLVEIVDQSHITEEDRGTVWWFG